MKNSPDPSVHRQRQQQFIEHVQRLLEDDRLRVDTTQGRRPVISLIRDVTRSDRGVDLKRLMSDMGLPDRELQGRMPVGESVEIVLSQRRWFLFKKLVGRLEVTCVSPTRALLAGEAPAPLNSGDVQKLLTEIAPPRAGVPSTLVLLSTSGFTRETHDLTERRADRTLILVEPNDAGGWSVYGPVETKALSDLFDPEAEDAKRQRVHEVIEKNKAELLSSGLATDRIAAQTQLPLQLIENELKSYAKEHPGLTARRLDGRMVLFREGAVPAASSGGGPDMPFLERVRSLFARKGDNEKKIAFLAERKTSLSQQRDRAYEDMATLEQKEGELRQQFKDSTSAITKRRLTSQLLQLRKDIERRQQLLGVLNQQINVVGTHLHNLELVQQGQAAKLPDTEELASDAAAAEEMLASLEADTELAGSVGQIAHAGMTAEEQALYEELERESGGEGVTSIKLETVEANGGEPTRPAPTKAEPQKKPAESARAEPPKRTEPEAG